MLIGYFETLSLDFSLRLPLHHCCVILLGYVPQFEALVLVVVGTCCSCLYCIFDLFAGYVHV